MKHSGLRSHATEHGSIAVLSLSGRHALCAALILGVSSAAAADYSWNSGTTTNWNNGTPWTTSPVDDATFPNDAGDTIAGNTGISVANLTTSLTIGNFTTTTAGWTVQGNHPTPGTELTFTIDGTLTGGSGVSFRSENNSGVQDGPLTLAIANVNANAGNINFGITTVVTNYLSGLTVNSTTMAGGNINISTNGDYSLGLLTISGTAGTLTLAQTAVNGGSTRTATVTGISGDSPSGTITIRANGSAGTSAATLLVNNASNYSTNALLANGGTGNTLALEKQGNGAQTLTRASTYTGGTTIAAGAILANNTSGSALGTGAISVGISGILGGTGSVAGPTTVSGVIAPGSGGIEDLEITNHVTWNGGVDWKFELGSANASDRLNITGAGSDFLKGSGAIWRFDFQNTGVIGNTYRLVDWADTTTFASGDFRFINLANDLDGFFEINGSQLDFTVVPEPCSSCLLGMSFAMLLMLRRCMYNRIVSGVDRKNIDQC